MYKIIDKAVLPNGTKIQLEDWHENTRPIILNCMDIQLQLILLLKILAEWDWLRLMIRSGLQLDLTNTPVIQMKKF